MAPSRSRSSRRGPKITLPVLRGTPRRSKHGLGWIPDLPDQRDLLYRTVRAVPGVLPQAVDLRPSCSAVEDQGNLGSCTANALVGALEFLEKKKAADPQDLSRLFIYYNERVIEGSVSTDSGAMLRDGIKTLAKQGVCSEKIWPYNVKRFAATPAARCYTDALDHQITSYHRILTLDEMLACLAEGFPFVFGFSVYESFESAETARTGVVTTPRPGERVIGGHAVMAVGYDDTAKRFIVRNSWGTKWGMKGYFSMPYEYLADRGLADDFWTIRAGENL